MRATRSRQADQRLRELLTGDHSLNGGILFGLDGHVIEVQARAMEVLRHATRGIAPGRGGGIAPLRPFVGAPDQPVQFIRPESWGNAYEVVLRLVWRAIFG